MDPSNPCDTQNFEKAFLDMKPVIGDEIDVVKVQEQERIDMEFVDSEDLIEISSPGISYLPEGTVDDREGYTLNNQPSIVTDAVYGVDKEAREGGGETAPKMSVDPEGNNPAKQTILKTRFVTPWKSSPLTQRTLESFSCEPHLSTHILNSLPLPMLPCL